MSSSGLHCDYVGAGKLIWIGPSVPEPVLILLSIYDQPHPTNLNVAKANGVASKQA